MHKGTENLKPKKKGEVSSELAKELQKKSVKKRKQNKLEKILLKEAIEERLGIDDLNDIVDNLIKRAKLYDKSLETLRDTLGQKPKEQIESKQDINITMDSNLDNWGK